MVRGQVAHSYAERDAVLTAKKKEDYVIPDSHRDIFDKQTFAYVATTGTDGTPQVTPVWVEPGDDGTVRFSTVKGRVKHRNLVADPRVALAAADPDNAYRYVQLRGRVQLTDDPGKDLINRLSSKYVGIDRYDHDGPTDERVVVTVVPDHVSVMG